MTCNCEPTTVHTPDPCSAETNQIATNMMRLFTLRCGTWVYSGQMSMNSPPQRGMRLVHDDKAYTVEQSTLVGSEPGVDKWEVMLIQAGPAYYSVNTQRHDTHFGGAPQCSREGQPCNGNMATTPIPGNPCMPCHPATMPPLPPSGGIDHDSPCVGWPTIPTQPGYPGHGGGSHNHGNNGGGTHYPYTPMPIEMGLGCGPHYECNGLPR